MYVIYDSKAEVYNRPFFLINDDIALRSALDLIQDTQTDLHRHPADFTMFKIGTYDDQTSIISDDQRTNICNFAELKLKMEPANA